LLFCWGCRKWCGIYYHPNWLRACILAFGRLLLRLQR
jgi:hypothetical protein